MLSVTVALPDTPTRRAPVVLVHGAANSSMVWILWQRELAQRGFASYAVDLRGHGASSAIDLSRVSMHDYAADVVAVCDQLAAPPVLVGWSMGGLVAMMVAEEGVAEACIALAPSTPALVTDAAAQLRAGEFDAAEYGITSDDPGDQPAMPDLDREERLIALASLGRESRFARDERAAGIVVRDLACPLLIVTGTADRQWPRSNYDGLHLPAEHLGIDGASHWGLVLSRVAVEEAVSGAVSWLDGHAGDGA
jgi:pimeloyl-ACP methyl ester carboxylesterase